MSNVFSIYSFNNYKEFINAWISDQPNNGHGEYRKIALALNVSTTMISQVFKADKQLSLEMAIELCEYLKLEDDETDYFILLVEYQKSGSYKLKKNFSKQIEARQANAKKLETRVKNTKPLSEETRSIFYSNWLYSGIRLLSDIGEYNQASQIAQKLNLPKNYVQKIIDFLLTHNLLTQQNGKLRMGPARTHIGSSSHHVLRHHQNWRILGFNRMNTQNNDDFFYTGPMTLSRQVAEKIRSELPEFVERINSEVVPSTSEVVRCLNIDWFEY